MRVCEWTCTCMEKKEYTHLLIHMCFINICLRHVYVHIYLLYTFYAVWIIQPNIQHYWRCKSVVPHCPVRWTQQALPVMYQTCFNWIIFNSTGYLDIVTVIFHYILDSVKFGMAKFAFIQIQLPEWHKLFNHVSSSYLFHYFWLFHHLPSSLLLATCFNHLSSNFI